MEKAREVGIEAKHFQLDEQCTDSELEELIEKLNVDPNIDGIIVQVEMGEVEEGIHFQSCHWIRSIKWTWKVSLTKLGQKKMWTD
jgi:hypothetical protein